MMYDVNFIKSHKCIISLQSEVLFYFEDSKNIPLPPTSKVLTVKSSKQKFFFQFGKSRFFLPVFVLMRIYRIGVSQARIV